LTGCTQYAELYANKIHFLLHFVQMSLPRLDRLSALLEGLAPVVTLNSAGPGAVGHSSGPAGDQGLCVYLISGGAMCLQWAGATVQVEGPALVALRASQVHRLSPPAATDQGRLICAHTQLTGPVATLFLEEFAEPRVLSLVMEEPALALALNLIEMELNAPRCGQPALLNRAGDILFIGLLRHLVAHPSPHGTGLFNGLADPRIAKALVAMHQRPGSYWSLERLAEVAGMSRTAFASSFRHVMKRTPGKYLAAIRLAMAQRTVDMGKGLKEAARTAGYGNASALSRALSRARSTHAE
jgi:AraC-like DNA-binding protein